MNVFIIPSWYPSETSPIAGIFTKEQAEALAELSQDINVIVSSWGHDDTYLSARHPLNWLSQIWRYGRHSVKSVSSRRNFIEVYTPKLHWSHRLPFGGANQLLNVNRLNLARATQLHGKIDIIHAHVSYPAGYIAFILSKEFGIPYVLTEHMSPFPLPGLKKYGKPISGISKAIIHTDACIAVSPSLSQDIQKWGYPKSVVIPNVVDERKFSVGAPTRKKFSFLTMARISEQKGIGDLLNAIALWNPSAAKVEFRIAGDGPQKKQYESQAKRLKIEDRITWLGPVGRDKAAELFIESHAYVMSSLHETFGVVYAEAIACGKPIIATRCGGPESIVNELNGLLVDVGDIKALAEAMETMTNNWASYDPLAIRQDFERRFSRCSVINQITDLYVKVIESRTS